MENALWALPIWMLCIPLAWAMYEKFHSPEGDSPATGFGVRSIPHDGKLLSLATHDGDPASAYGWVSMRFS